MDITRIKSGDMVKLRYGGKRYACTEAKEDNTTKLDCRITLKGLDPMDTEVVELYNKDGSYLEDGKESKYDIVKIIKPMKRGACPEELLNGWRDKNTAPKDGSLFFSTKRSGDKFRIPYPTIWDKDEEAFVVFIWLEGAAAMRVNVDVEYWRPIGDLKAPEEEVFEYDNRPNG